MTECTVRASPTSPHRARLERIPCVRHAACARVAQVLQAALRGGSGKKELVDSTYSV